MARYTFRELVVDSRTGLNPRKNFTLGNGSNYYITIKDIHDGKIVITEKTDRVNDDAIAMIKKRSRIKNGDILFTSIGRIGETAIVTNKDDTWDVNESVFIFTLNADIITQEFFCALFQSKDIQDRLTRDSSGSTFKSIKMNQLEKMSFNIPDLDVQSRIVSELSKVDSLIVARREQLAKLDELVKSRFIELFGDSEQNPRGLPVLPWSKVFLTTTGKLDSNAMVENGQYPFFTCAKESFWIDTYAFDCEALLLAGNNAAGVYDVKHYKGKFNAYQRTYVLRLINDQWSYKLFKRQLEDKLRYLQSQSKGTNTRYLTLGILNELRFVVPPVAEQEQFATFVEQTDKSKLAIQESLAELETLKKALMQKYFG